MTLNIISLIDMIKATFKKTAIPTLLVLSCISSNASAEARLLGKWSDKTNPEDHKFEFKKNSDFVYRHPAAFSLNEYVVVRGVWQVGAWEVTNNITKAKRSCRITIYAGKYECCFEYKFIANNLILTNEYDSSLGSSSMCENRVLIQQE